MSVLRSTCVICASARTLHTLRQGLSAKQPRHALAVLASPIHSASKRPPASRAGAPAPPAPRRTAGRRRSGPLPRSRPRRPPSDLRLSRTVSKPGPRAPSSAAADGAPRPPTRSATSARGSDPSAVGPGRSGPFAGTNRTSFAGGGARLLEGRRRRALAAREARRERFAGRGGGGGGGSGGGDARAGKRKNRSEYGALKMQQALAHVGYGARAAVKKAIRGRETFAEMPLLPAVLEAIAPQALGHGAEGEGDVRPTPIQRLAVPALLGVGTRRKKRTGEAPAPAMQQFLLAAETGSGKTLAYLIPAINALKAAEAEEAGQKKHDDARKSGILDLFSAAQAESKDSSGIARPRSIVLVPTSELVDQVGAVAKAFSHKVKFRASLVSAAYSSTVIRKRLFAPGGIDILIATPQLLANIVRSDPYILSWVQSLIIDEADSLLDRSFEEHTNQIIDRASPTLRQLVFCSATIPKKMDHYLRSHYPQLVRLTTPNLHAIPRRVQLTVVDVTKGNYFGNKDLACANTIWSIGRSLEARFGPDANRTKKILVFVNEREKTDELAKYLQDKGIDAVALNRDSTTRGEKDVLSSFRETSADDDVPEEDVEPQQAPAADSAAVRRLANTKVLVATDLASRGIDTTAVRDVILYDVPHSSIDFIHRLGRTGRMGRRGRGFVLVDGRDRRDIVADVRHGMFRGQALI
jgi:ATP-dependent RNA helicase MRH4